MENVKRKASENDWNTVKQVEQRLIANDFAVPTIEEFDGTVDRTKRPSELRWTETRYNETLTECI